MKRKGINATAKFLVPLTFFLSASYAHAFLSLSSAAENQIQLNQLIPLQQPMSNPKHKPSCEPICKPTNDQTTNEVQPSFTFNTSYMFETVNGINPTYTFEAVNGVSAKPFEAVIGVNNAHYKYIVTNRVTFSNEQDDEIQSQSPVESNTRTQIKRSSTNACLVLFSSFQTGFHPSWSSL